MRTLVTRPTAALLVLSAFAFTFLVGPSAAQAAWRDRSDELPGMSSSTGLFIVAGLATAALVTVLLVKKHHNDQAGRTQVGTGSTQDTSQESDSTAVHRDKTEIPTQSSLLPPQETKTQLRIFYGLDQVSQESKLGSPPLSLSDLKLKAGVSISF